MLSAMWKLRIANAANIFTKHSKNARLLIDVLFPQNIAFDKKTFLLFFHASMSLFKDSCNLSTTQM